MKLTRHCLGGIAKMLDFYSQFNPSPLSIKQFFDFGEFPPRNAEPGVSILRTSRARARRFFRVD